MPQTIQSLEGFTRKIRKIIPEADEVLLFRGHSNRRKFRLLPSVMRKSRFQQAEDAILRELIASPPSEFITDALTLEPSARVHHRSNIFLTALLKYKLLRT
jgi:hypothetical protein